MLARVRAVVLVTLVLEAVACKAESAGPLSAALLAEICDAEHVDETSQIFVARNREGVVERIVVTPTKRIADMGNLVFDMDGKLLGHKTGSEFPQHDAARMAKERERVAALMNGAEIVNGEPPLTCP